MSTSGSAAAPQASQVPQISTTSPTGHTTTLPSSPSAPPASAPAQAAPATTTTPHATSIPPPPNPATPDRSADQDDLTYNEQLNAVDRYWKFKMALQIAMILASIIGIGCLGWALSTANSMTFGSGYGNSWALPWGLITFSISLLWCFICIMRFVIAKRPVHPGVRVTMELLLWIGFILTALLTLAALFDLLYWGDGSDLASSLGYSSSYGEYVLEKNNTWVWESSDNVVGYQRVCNGSSSASYYQSLPFHNCAEMDAYVNMLWHEKGNRARVELTAVVTQWLGVLLHFTLFVWACVDCHKHRHSKVSKDAEKLAAGIVQNMVQSGAIMPPPGGHGQWQQPYQQLPNGANSYSAPGGYGPGGYGPGGYAQPYPVQGQHPVAKQMGPQMQMNGQQPMSPEGPLPPLPSRSQQPQAHAGPSNGKAPVQDGGVASSYYEPQR